MNIMKNSRDKYRTENSFKIWLGSFLRLNVRSNYHGKIRQCIFHTSIHISKLTNNEIVKVFLVRQNDSCPEIDVSGQQNAEN